MKNADVMWASIHDFPSTESFLMSIRKLSYSTSSSSTIQTKYLFPKKAAIKLIVLAETNVSIYDG